MAIRVLRWIGSNGEILTPLTVETYNEGRMISTHGTYFIPQTIEEVAIVAGNPMGLLLTLTYPA